MMTVAQAKHYLWEVARESELVELLYTRFLSAAEAWLRADHVENPDGTVLWTSIDSEREMQSALEGVLAGFARISLFFFPSRSAGERGEEREAVLRRLTGIDETHPLSQRDLRNHWMHLDERLDSILAASGAVPVGFYLDRAHRIPQERRKEFFRLVDPGDGIVYILGEAFHLRTLADAVEHAGNQAALVIVDNVSSDGAV